jgi:tetratricopeptide (TPR) repeat protein
MRGEFSESENFAQQAVNFAQQKQLENLAASSLLELGNAYSSKGIDEKAELYYGQAIQLSKANKARQTEAKAESNLGSLFIRTSRVDAGLRMVEQALNFFQQENYLRSVGICLTQMGRGYRRQANFTAAEQALNQKLALAEQGKNQPSIADSHFELGLVRLDQERYPDALQEFETALAIYRDVKNGLRIAFTDTNRVRIFVQLGRYGEASQLLDELFKSTSESTGFLTLVPELHLVKAELSLTRGDLAQAAASVNEAIRTAPAKSDLLMESKYVLALVDAETGKHADAKKLCDEAMDSASTAGNAVLHSRAMLACAESAWKGNDAGNALSLALQAQERFATGHQAESEWRAWFIAGRASNKLGDKSRSDEMLNNALSTRSRLEQQWGPETFKQYTSRPDIQVYFR